MSDLTYQSRFDATVKRGKKRDHRILRHFRLLLIAEQLNPKVKSSEVLDSTSGRFLKSCLHRRWNTTKVNALGRGSPTDKVLVELSKSHDVTVALGSKACKRLHSLNLHHNVIPHPQWARRFGGTKHVSTRWYRTLINLSVGHALRHT